MRLKWKSRLENIANNIILLLENKRRFSKEKSLVRHFILPTVCLFVCLFILVLRGNLLAISQRFSFIVYIHNFRGPRFFIFFFIYLFVCLFLNLLRATTNNKQNKNRRNILVNDLCANLSSFLFTVDKLLLTHFFVVFVVAFILLEIIL